LKIDNWKLVHGPNTYAAPVPPFTPNAPTTPVEPRIATDEPKTSFITPSGSATLALKLDVVLQPVLGFRNTYTAPSKLLALAAATATALPLIARN
jgi:hypothetical protein